MGGSVHDLTADHPLRVMRSGEWTWAETRALRMGDVVKTSGGIQAVQHTEPPRGICGDVFSLQMSKGEEIYAFTREDGDVVSLSGVAVLGSPDPERMQRSSSAPPGFRSDVPSRGSLKCMGGPSCTNVCRKFMRGKCEERSCRFCHFSHPQERKRQPRGPRESKSGSSRSTMESMD